MASFTDTQIRTMVEIYRKKLGIRKKIEVVIIPMNKFDGLGRRGKIWINSKRLNDGRYSDDAVRRLVVHEMVHAWKEEYGKGGTKLNRGHSPAFYRAYEQSLRVLGIPDFGTG